MMTTNEILSYDNGNNGDTREQCENHHSPRPRQRGRMKKRTACVFENTKTWKHLNVDGEHEHEITAHWEGLLTGKLVVLVDGEVACIQTRDQQDYNPTDPYGHFTVDGHEVEFSPTVQEWSGPGNSSMDLAIDGHRFSPDDVRDDVVTTHDMAVAEAARAVAHDIPPFEYDSD